MQNWSKGVELELHGIGGYRTVKSTEDAARCLLEYWPPGRGRKAYTAAQQACLDALEGRIPPDIAREAFIGAAQAARIHMRSTEDPRERAMKSGAARNRISGTDSPAFRKANSDAMKAIKKSVAKMKAERDRFLREQGDGRE